MKHTVHLVILLVLCTTLPSAAAAQGTVADYQRAAGLREKYEGAAVNCVDHVGWIEKASRFWYHKSVKGGYEFVLVDAETHTTAPAFDPQKLAAPFWLDP